MVARVGQRDCKMFTKHPLDRCSHGKGLDLSKQRIWTKRIIAKIGEARAPGPTLSQTISKVYVCSLHLYAARDPATICDLAPVPASEGNSRLGPDIINPSSD